MHLSAYNRIIKIVMLILHFQILECKKIYEMMLTFVLRKYILMSHFRQEMHTIEYL